MLQPRRLGKFHEHNGFEKAGLRLVGHEIITRSVEETKRAAGALVGHLRRGDVVSLTGDLGAGKTAFVQGLAERMGIDQRITSPTFTIIKEYSNAIPLYHLDVYRLDSPAELVDLGYEEYLFGDGVCLVEWGDRIRDLFPPDHLEIDFQYAGEDTRRIRFVAHGERWEKVIDEVIGDIRREVGD